MLEVHVQETGHINYTVEAFNQLCHYYLLSPRYAEQLIWSRFANK